MHTITGANKFLFPNQRDHEKPATNLAFWRQSSAWDTAAR